jgi:hypothetical protein
LWAGHLSSPAFSYIALLDFESIEAYQVAIAAHGDEIIGDVPNFTNGTPIFQVSDVKLG